MKITDSVLARYTKLEAEAQALANEQKRVADQLEALREALKESGSCATKHFICTVKIIEVPGRRSMSIERLQNSDVANLEQILTECGVIQQGEPKQRLVITVARKDGKAKTTSVFKTV